VVSCVVIARLTGSFFWNGWLDNFLQLAALRKQKIRVVIIGIDENDIKAVGDYPVPNRDLAKCSEFSRATSQGQLVSICLGISRLTQVMLS